MSDKPAARRAEELSRIAAANGGILHPEDVVAAAEKKSSPLHSWFEWNDGAAAHAFRLEQARKLIRVTVRVANINNTNRDVRVFVSLTPDREDGGYREIKAVLQDPSLRQQLIKDALEDLRRMELKYSELKELADVFAASARFRRQFEGLF